MPPQKDLHRALHDRDAFEGSKVRGAGVAEAYPSFDKDPGIFPYHSRHYQDGQ